MKKYLYTSTLLLLTVAAASQPIPPQSIEDSTIGWMKVYNFKGIKESKKVDDKFYSAAQLSICDSFANWIQASYTPKGGLGDVKKAISEKLGSYNQHTASLPQRYGAYAKIYTDLRYNSNRKIEPISNLGLSWGVFANEVPGWPVNAICTPAQYYFTMPSFETSGNEEVAKLHDMTRIANLKPYRSFWIKNIEAGNGTDYVLLCRDNKSPFIKITKGEYLMLLETGIQQFYDVEKRKIYAQNKDNQKSIDYFIKYLDDRTARFINGLKANREKYSNRLAEIALTGKQPSLYDLENERDLFSNGYLQDPESTLGRVPVYKIDPEMAALCKKDTPQWILVSWWWTPNNPAEKYMHESITNNFNFEYVYNFFFNPEKVKGQIYKPLRSPAFKETVTVMAESAALRKNTADKNIHFFEDFSTTVIGKKPNGWQGKLALDGTSSIITKLDGLAGNWAVMKGNYSLTPNQLKKPIPQNFTLTYELVAAQNFTWGAKGLCFQLSKETSPGNTEYYLQLRLCPGFNGSDGAAILETQFPAPPGYLNGSKSLIATGFSNNKQNNHITVTIKKKEETLQVFIDKTKIGEYEKAIPAALLFNAMSFYVNGSSGENDKLYFSNIKIVKD
jgi:hypothetical protein